MKLTDVIQMTKSNILNPKIIEYFPSYQEFFNFFFKYFQQS